MKSILLIGLGRFGKHIAMKLHELGQEVMAVDIREDRVEECLPFVTNAVIGDSTRQSFLESLGASDYDLCIVAIGDNFQSSLETTSLLKELGAPVVVSRACGDFQEKFLLKNGADKVVYPEKELAQWTAITYSSDQIFDYFSMGEGYAVMEVQVPASWVGKTVGQMDIRKKYGINIMAFKNGKDLNMRVEVGTVFTGKETLMVLGRDSDIHRCFRI